MPHPLNGSTPRFLAAGLALVALATTAQAQPWWLRGSAAAGRHFLPPDAAFRVSARIVGGKIALHWDIAHGYYLYRGKMNISAASPDLSVAPLQLPPGVLLTDRYFGPQQVYFHQANASAAYTRFDYGAHPIQIKLSYQGCAKAGLCYPPIVKVIFPDEATPAMTAPNPLTPSATREGIAIGAGLLAFLAAGLMGRGRRARPQRDA